MYTLYLNCDPSQPVSFSSFEQMRDAIISNPFRYDSLSLMEEVNTQGGQAVVVLSYVETYDAWEIEDMEFSDPITPDSLEEAVEEFIERLVDWGIF